MQQQTGSTEKDAFLVDLRTRTTPSHKALEANPYSVALMAHETTLENYATYLKKLYGFVKPYENKVFDVLAVHVPNIDDRRKTALIVSDLKALGYNEEQIAALPIYDYPAPTSVAQAFGAMYVLEGSTLGGSIIYKRLNHLIQVDKEHNGRYFTAYGDTSGLKWKEFVNVFAERTVADNAQSETIDSAVATFTAMDNWLGKA